MARREEDQRRGRRGEETTGGSETQSQRGGRETCGERQGEVVRHLAERTESRWQRESGEGGKDYVLAREGDEPGREGRRVRSDENQERDGHFTPCACHMIDHVMGTCAE